MRESIANRFGFSQREREPHSLKPLVSIGWVVASDVREKAVLEAYEGARQRVLGILSQQFSQFHWEMPLVKRPRYLPQGALDPIPLLEMGVDEKIHSGWDYALVVVSNELAPRYHVLTIGVPSSALEVAVMSSARLDPSPQSSNALAGLALHLLGHMWGLEHEKEGPMSPVAHGEMPGVGFYPSRQKAEVVDRLEEVADKRLEEEKHESGRLLFHWRAFWADPEGILTDIWGYAPWKLPFRMGRLSAAAAGSLIFVILTAEAWEIGVNFSTHLLIIGFFLSVFIATLFILVGHNLGQISHEMAWREQLARTRIVLFCTLFFSMVTLWGILFMFSFMAALFIPSTVPAEWLDKALTWQNLLRHAAFMATVGIFAAALGGNLEEENKIKAKLFYDEET